MDNDDAPVGRILSRREIFALLGGSAAAAALIAAGCSDESSTPAATSTAATTTGTATGSTATATGITKAAASATGAATGTTAATTATVTPNCVAVPALTEGPYFVDEHLNRSDIRSDPASGSVRPGTPLTVAFNVLQMATNACAALPNATVDVWHCDAAGAYSDVTDQGFNTKGQQFLRGYQVTDSLGNARFTTIYPGWYQGRSVHLHFKVRGNTANGKSFEFTSQLFFDESVTDVVHAQQPYAAKGKRTLLNDGDGIYRQSGGKTLVKPVKSGDGYAVEFSLGLQLS